MEHHGNQRDLAKFGSDLNSRINDLDLKLDTISETLNERLNDHEDRIASLEQQAAHA